MEKRATEFNKKPHTGEDSVIIQCPSCQTKFAVPATSIPKEKSTKKNPRFHCSRCDGIFSHSIEGFENRGSSPQHLESTSSRNEAKASTEPVAAKDVTVNNAKVDFSEDAVQMELPLGTKLKSVSRPHAYEDPKREADMLAETQELNFSEMSEKQAVKKKNNPFSKEALLKEISARQKMGENPAVVEEKGVWRGFRRILAPAVMSLLLIIIFSLSLSANLTPSISVVDKLMAGQPHLPPPELFISNLSYNRVRLLDGSEVPVVSGTLVNRTSSPVSEVLLEGIAFGQTGQFISSEKVGAASAGSSYEGFENMSTVAELRAIQSKKTPKNWKIMAGAQKDFSLAITGIEAENARFYSARVHSVR